MIIYINAALYSVVLLLLSLLFILILILFPIAVIWIYASQLAAVDNVLRICTCSQHNTAQCILYTNNTQTQSPSRPSLRFRCRLARVANDSRRTKHNTASTTLTRIFKQQQQQTYICICIQYIYIRVRQAIIIVIIILTITTVHSIETISCN